MSAVEKRVIIALQRRGNVGKSTTLGIFAQYLEQHGLPWRGFDLDSEHKNFSRLFPEQVTLVEIGDEPEADIIRLARASFETPLLLIDPRAHQNDLILRAWDIIRFAETFSAAGGRATVILFAADDLEVMTDIDATVSRLQGTVDYVVVKNRARAPRTRMFDGSELEADLHGIGAVELEVPSLLAPARNHLAALEAELGRGVTHLEAVANRKLPLDGMMRLVIDDWLRGLFRRIDPISPHLMPAAYASKVAPVDTAPRVDVPSKKRGAKINRTNL
jgi:hypothetical protein